MAPLSDNFVNETLWPEFLELKAPLAAYFDALPHRVIEQALDVKAGEAEERREQGTATGNPESQLEPADHQPSVL